MSVKEAPDCHKHWVDIVQMPVFRTIGRTSGKLLVSRHIRTFYVNSFCFHAPISVCKLIIQNLCALILGLMNHIAVLSWHYVQNCSLIWCFVCVKANNYHCRTWIWAHKIFVISSPPSAAHMHWWTGSALVQIGSGMLPVPCQAITWTNADVLSIGAMETDRNEIQIEIKKVSFMKIHMKMLSVKWQPFYSRGRGVKGALGHQ